ncbi:MAG: GH3 auxin-responsive promoter family protein [Rikenellaceae bacterium]
MSLQSRLIKLYYSQRIKEIDKFRRSALEVAENQYSYLLKLLSQTQYGEERGVKEGLSYRDFTSKIPVVTYEDISTEIEAVVRGEWQRLCPSKPKWFAKSSGTTNAVSKFIPTTDEALNYTHYRGTKDVAAIYSHLFPNGAAMDGKVLTLGGSLVNNPEDKESVIGDLSGILITNTPSILDFKRFPTEQIALDSNFERKIAKIASLSVKQNVTSFAGVPSWYLILMNSILDYTGKSNMYEIWPNMSLFAHGGMSFTPYKDSYKKLFPSEKMCYIETYNASEGFFAIGDDLSRDDMLLMLDYRVFYEFLECSEIGSFSEVIPLEGVEVGKNYAMIITTAGGLWRYMIGDTVTFTSTSPYRIKITGRTKHFINIAGEEVIVDNAERAILEACKATDSEVLEYTAAPIFMEGRNKGRHEWVFEFKRLPNSLDKFIEVLDNTLQSINSDYSVKRVGGALDCPKIVVAGSGTFYNWMKKRGKLGGQNKIPRLSNDRKYIDTLLENILQGEF